jgi:hypothetical protein
VSAALRQRPSKFAPWIEAGSPGDRTCSRKGRCHAPWAFLESLGRILAMCKLIGFQL